MIQRMHAADVEVAIGFWRKHTRCQKVDDPLSCGRFSFIGKEALRLLLTGARSRGAVATLSRGRMPVACWRCGKCASFAVARCCNSPGRVIEFARGADAGIPDIHIQTQIGVRRPLPQRAKAHLVGVGRHGGTCRNKNLEQKQ